MTPTVFDNDDIPYLRWMADNPNGYVLNARSDAGSRYLKFHRSGCRHITTYTRSHAEGAFTAHDYLKVCSNEASDLIEWAVANRPGGVSYESCKTCTPGIESVTVPLAEEVPAGKRRFPSIIEKAISSKARIQAITADTFRSDAAAILESLIAELDEDAVLDAMNNQGFAAKSYCATIRALAAVARERRLLRKAGSGTGKKSSWKKNAKKCLTHKN